MNNQEQMHESDDGACTHRPLGMNTSTEQSRIAQTRRFAVTAAYSSAYLIGSIETRLKPPYRSFSPVRLRTFGGSRRVALRLLAT